MADGDGANGTKAGLVLAICSVATFLDFLDVTVVNVAFPDLQRDFAGTSLSALSWVVTAYAVMFAALLTPAGRLADVVGRKRVFLTGTAVFVAASAASALAPSVGALIAARAVQGAAAAVTIPAALGILLASTPPERRSAAVGLWAATTSIAALAGPALGGVLVDAFDWRAVFLVNVPIGIATVVAGARILPGTRPTERTLPDGLGTATLAAALTLLVVGVTKAGDWGWTAVPTVGFAAAGAVLLAAALVRARGNPAPAIETSLWRNHRFAVTNLASFVIGAAVYAWLLVCVLFVVTHWHYSILEAGLAVSPGALSSAVAAVIAGRLAGRYGSRPVVVAGALMIVVAGIWGAAEVGPEPRFVEFWLPAGLFSGVAFGTAMTGLATAAATSVPPARFAAGIGMNMTARQVGGALGVALMATILDAQDGSVDAFSDVFALCAAVGAVGALVATRLVPSAPPIDAAVPSAERA